MTDDRVEGAWPSSCTYTLHEAKVSKVQDYNSRKLRM